MNTEPTAASATPATPATPGTPVTPGAKVPTVTWSPWRAVVGFGLVSFAADMVYEGARSVTGPLLATLGASALVVGVVTGAGEAVALVLRLFFGSLADRTGRYWALTLSGYGMTAVFVPLLAITPFIGSLGLALASVLVISERAGKAVRSPAKSTLLSYAASDVGMGRGFAVHKALDQLGAFSGPLLVAAVTAVTGALWPAFLALAVPGLAAIGLLLWVRHRVGDPHRKERTEPDAATIGHRMRDLPQQFWLFAASAGAATAGLVTFGVIAFHLTREHVVSTASIPLVYAAGMAAEAVAALITGWAYDRWGAKVLLVLPVLVAIVPAMAFSTGLALVLGGVLIWGAATGLQDSTVKALVADLVPAARRATAYGAFAAVQGATAVLGGAMAGWFYSRSIPLLVLTVAITQVIALALMIATLRRPATDPDGQTG